MLWCRCTSCDFSVLSLTSRRGPTWAQCQSDGWDQRSCHWPATWTTLSVWTRHVRVSKTGFNPTVHSSMSVYFNTPRYQLTAAHIIHKNKTATPCAGVERVISSFILLIYVSLRVFTPACPLTWRRQCIQLGLRTTTAGAHFYTHTTCLSLKHKKPKSFSP